MTPDRPAADEKDEHVDAIEDVAHGEKHGTSAVLANVSPKEARRVRWKLDLILMPVLAFCYLLQFLDKQTLNYATLLGMLEDTHLVGGQYSWTASIFYFGYIFWSYPTAYLAVRLPIGKYLSCTVVVWAVVLMCHGVCKNFSGLMATRFFLGAFEAGVAPGFSLVTGMWFTRREQPLRYGMWFSGNCLANLLGGLVAYQIGHIDGDLASWRYLFLILGGVTGAWGLVMMVMVPDRQENTFWLKPRERQVAVQRLLEDKQGSSKGEYKMYQAVEAFKDPTTWFLLLYTFCVNIANGGLTSFGSLVIKGFGYKGLQALLIQMPSGASQLGFVVVSSVICSYVPNARIITMIVLTIISVVGIVLMYALDPSNRSGRLGGYCICLAFSANLPLAFSVVTSNVAGFTKIATVNACVLVMYCAGNIVGPQFFSVEEAPNYPRGIKACLSGLCLGVVWLVCLRFYLACQNTRRDRANMESAQDEYSDDSEVLAVLEDKTDWEIPSRRYVL